MSDSSNNNYNPESGNTNDDELSKLISKRSQIKRSVKRDTIEAAQEKLATSIEPVVDLDLDALPEFTYDRRRLPSRKDNDVDEDSDEDTNLDDDTNDDESTKKKKKKKKKQQQSDEKASIPDNAPIIDYMADYSDENDWHVVNRIGITTQCWGDPQRNFVTATTTKLTKRLQKAGKFVAGDVQLAMSKLLAGGITLLETSPTYGSMSRNIQLSAEQILQQCLSSTSSASLPEPAIIERLDTTAGILSSLQSTLRPGATMISSLENSLSRLSGTTSSMSSVDLFLAPASSPLVPTRIIAAGLAAQIESGQANHVGTVGITSPRRLLRLQQHLERRYDCTLTANAIPFSLTQSQHEDMIRVCKDNGVVPLILDPYHGGLASGIYTATNPSGGITGTKPPFTFAQLDKLQALHSVQETLTEKVRNRVIRTMRDVQERYKPKYGPPPRAINTDITTTQIALQYIIAKGGVPLVPVNNPSQADDVLGCLGWTLNDEEVDMLDAAVALCRL